MSNLNVDYFQSFEQRADKIRKHIENNELRHAVLQTMDLVKEFRPRDKNAVAILKSDFNRLDDNTRLGKLSYEEEQRQIRIFQDRVLKFVDIVAETVEQSQPAGWSTTEESPPANSSSSAGKTDLEVSRQLYAENREKLLSSAARESDIVVEGKEISKNYRGKKTKFSLKPIDFKLRLGEITGLVGENASGKSTLLKIIAGVLTPSSGDLNYPGLVMNPNKDVSLPYQIKQQIAYIPQDLPHWPGSLLESLRFIAGTRGILGEENKEEVGFYISRLSLEKYQEESWDDISGGFKTRFTLAQQILKRPKLMVLDEPLANLDIITQRDFLQDLRDFTRFRNRPVSVIISSQHLHEIESIADNIIFLREGREIYNGSLADLGKNRGQNVFEIECDRGKEEIIEVIRNTDFISVERWASRYVIYTGMGTSGNEILQCFIQSGINVPFFQDISGSTKKLFLEERQLE